MSFEEFINEVAQKIKDFLPEKYADSNISVQRVYKNNETLDGLLISSPDLNICPNIYLNGFYDMYLDGMNMDTILKQIADCRVENEALEQFDLSRICDFEKVKGCIVPRIYGAAGNEKFLLERPHRLIEDLAITYCVMLDLEYDCVMSSTITYQLMSSWGINPDELHEIALSNMGTLFPSKFMPMNAVMAEMMMPEIIQECDGDREMAEEIVATMLPPEDIMYVVTNEKKMNGATALLDTNLMDSIVSKFGDDFFILPSSVHECIIVPAVAGMSIEDLEMMVMEVNATQVDPRDRLSNQVYRYDPVEKEILLASHMDERLKEREAQMTQQQGITDQMSVMRHRGR